MVATTKRLLCLPPNCSGHIAERMSLRYFLCGGMILSGVFTAAVGLAQFFSIHQYLFFISMMVGITVTLFLTRLPKI